MFEKLLDIPTVQFCEKISAGVIKRPWYAFSNIGYLLVGLIILRKSGREILGGLLGFTSLIVGLLSFIYDSTYIRLTQIADIKGMFLFAFVSIFIAQSDIFKLTLKKYVFYLLPLWLVLVVTTYFMGAQSGNIIFGALIVFYLGLEFYCYKEKIHANYKNLLIGLALTLIGFSVWLLDTTKTVCFDSGLLNGRSIFHFLTSITIYQLYLFYSSQKLTLKLK